MTSLQLCFPIQQTAAGDIPAPLPLAFEALELNAVGSVRAASHADTGEEGEGRGGEGEARALAFPPLLRHEKIGKQVFFALLFPVL